MLATLLTTAVLTLGQGEATSLGTEPSADAKPTVSQGFLMQSLSRTHLGPGLDCRKIQISGWTDMSFTASNLTGNLLPMGFNYRGNEFLLQQNWLRIERGVDKDAKAPTFGFRADTILPGSDYRFTVARGLWDGQLTARNGEPNLYGFDPVQVYAEAYCPNVCKGLDLKFGRFFAQYGLESIDAPGSALWSHAYSFIYNPFTHTGALATLQLNDVWSVQAGLVLGCDVFIDPADNPTFLGSIKWASTDGNDSVLFSMIVGCGRFNQAENFHNPQVFDLVAVHKFNARFTYTFEGLYGCTTNVPGIGFANWFGILNYGTCEFTPKLSGTTRLEFFDDLQGQRTGFEGLYTAVTAGLSYRPSRAVLVRPEIRYDVNSESRPFQNQRGLFTAGADLIVRW